jgi:hypothetical protein
MSAGLAALAAYAVLAGSFSVQGSFGALLDEFFSAEPLQALQGITLGGFFLGFLRGLFLGHAGQCTVKRCARQFRCVSLSRWIVNSKGAKTEVHAS